MKSESLLLFLNDLPRTDFFCNAKIEEEYKRAFSTHSSVTNELLSKLSLEHKQITRMSKEFTNLSFAKEDPYKHYYETEKRVVAVCLPRTTYT